MHVANCRQRDVDGTESFRDGHEVDGLAEQQVDQAAIRAQENADHTADDHDGNKVGGVQDGLDDLLKAFEPQLVDCQGQDDGHRGSSTAGCTG